MEPKLNFALICDKAFSEAPGLNGKGKLNIMGIFQFVYSNGKFPMMLPQFSVVLNFSLGDSDSHRILVLLRDDLGNEIAKINELEIKQDNSTGDVNYIGNFAGVVMYRNSKIDVCYQIDGGKIEKSAIIDLKEQ